jgi:hypothetical protein
VVGDPILTGGFFNIFCHPVMQLQDAALDLYKPTLCEALRNGTKCLRHPCCCPPATSPPTMSLDLGLSATLLYFGLLLRG